MAKIIIGIILAVFVIVFITQNTMVVDINLFALTTSVSLAILILIIFLAGIAIGFVFTEIACIRQNMKKRKKERGQRDKEEKKTDDVKKEQQKREDKK